LGHLPESLVPEIFMEQLMVVLDELNEPLGISVAINPE
jgi:hypothetical protein